MRSDFKAHTVLLLVALPCVFCILSLCIGRVETDVITVFKSIVSKFTSAEGSVPAVETTLWKIRFPRILVSALVGMGLSVSGLVFQSLFSNPLATSDTLGVSGGACFGAVLGILSGFPMALVQLFAFLTGILSLVLTYLGGRLKNNSTSSLLLSGIMVGALFNALISLVRFLADTETQLPSITYFLMGSFAGKGYTVLMFGVPVICGSLILIYLLRWHLNILVLTEDEIYSLGVNAKALRAVTLILATLIISACVSMCGQVGWIGLLVPHLCRLKLGNDNRRLVPACISVGSILMVITDTVARSLFASEIPVSVLTAIIGAPFFVILLQKNRGLIL